MRHGKLMIVGGAEQSSRIAICRSFLEMASGMTDRDIASPRKARIAVVPTSTVDPRGGHKRMQAWFAEAGGDPERVELLEASLKVEGWERGAWNASVAQRAAAADGIWFLGGDQSLTMKCLLGAGGEESPLLTAIRDAWARGCALGGTSAGAAIMSDPMIGGGTSFGALAMPPAKDAAEAADERRLYLTPGLGFFPEGIVDQHFDARARLARLVQAQFEAGRSSVAFGISEATALIYDPGSRGVDVLGRNAVCVVDTSVASRHRVGGGWR